MIKVLFGRIVAISILNVCFVANALATTFPQFLESLPRLPDGRYVYDYDIATDNINTLYAYYGTKVLKKLSLGLSGSGEEVTPSSLVKTDSNGDDAVWESPQKDNLTYCIQRDGTRGFQDNIYRVSNAMAVATQDWEAAANINFTHLSSEDNNCERSDRVLFRVMKTWATWQGGGVQAASFFPDDPPQNRTLWIAADMPENTPDPLSFSGLLRHELGHILGLVHEHARKDECPESGWRALTGYDLYSVMHYRVLCNGPNVDYFLTDLDKDGVSQLYPFPPDPPPGPTNHLPVARLAISGKAYAQQPTLLDGTASNDPDGHITRYDWVFGDGQSARTIAPIVEHVYQRTGVFNASLSVEDNHQARSANTAHVDVHVEFNPALYPALYDYLIN